MITLIFSVLSFGAGYFCGAHPEKVKAVWEYLKKKFQ